MPNQPHPAYSRHGSHWRFESLGMAAVADAGRPHHMRFLCSTFLLAVMFAVGCERSKAPATPEAAGGQKIEKEYFADGTLKSVIRLNPDGSLLGRLYYSNGVPGHADYFDDQKRVRRTLLYRADGTAQTSREFDEHGKLVAEQQLDATGAPMEKTP